MISVDVYGYFLRGVQLSVLSISIYCLAVAIYRIFFHPLAKYPGPFWAKVLDFRAAYHAWTGDLHLDIWKCHEKYGDFIRYGPNHILVNSPQGLRDVYGIGKNFPKAPEYGVMVHKAPSTFTCLDKKEHLRKRHLLSQCFSIAAIKSYQPIILDQIANFCNAICPPAGNAGGVKEHGWSPAVNISHWCDYLFFDLITNITFGISYNLLGSEKYRFIIEAIETSNVRISVLVQMPYLTTWNLDRKLFPRAIVARKIFLGFMRRLVMSRMAAVGGKDAFSILLESKDPETGKGLDISEIGSEAIALLVAGSDTSATLAASIFFYVSQNPDVYQKVMQEVREKFSSLEEIGMGAKLTSCTYLRACIEECLRMSPPVGAALMRAVPDGGATVDGHYIPGGALVGAGIYASHHTESNFPDSFRFRPERWLESCRVSSTGKMELGTPGFFPFAMGTRSCIGKGLALVEAMLLTATVCFLFDFKRANPALGHTGGGSLGEVFGRHRPDEFQLSDHITSAKDGPLLQFRRRQIS